MHFTTSPPPRTFPLDPDNIPEEMRVLPNWVCWKFETRGGKETKVPYNPRTMQKASANDPQTWGSFEEACARIGKSGVAGAGFQFGNSPFCGIDTDHKAYDGEIHPTAAWIVAELNSYTETSPSGKGQHVIIKGHHPAWAKHREQLHEDLEIEVYSEGRFFTITGNLILAPVIEEAQESLEALLRELGMEKPAAPERPTFTGQSASFTGSDNELWERMFQSSSGSGVKALADGDLSQHGGDRSRADFALCGHLCFWTNGDAGRMDNMFRSSGLMRPKWDTKHSSEGHTYGQMTIQNVLSRWDGQGYDPSRKREAPAAEQHDWNTPEVLMRGRQHLATSGSHGRTLNSYSTLWQAVVGIVAAGLTIQDGQTITITSYGMTELYARAGGRMVDRRQQLHFLHSQGMCGPLIRQDPGNPKSTWLLTLPANPAMLPMWAAREPLPALPVNQIQRPKQRQTPPLSLVNKDYGSINTFPKPSEGFLPFWTLFALSILSTAETQMVADLAEVSPHVVRQHLNSLPTIVTKTGRIWTSVLTPQQVGELHLHLTAPQVERRRKKILEARLEFHETKAGVLAARGLSNQARLHFVYAEKYRRHLGAA